MDDKNILSADLEKILSELEDIEPHVREGAREKLVEMGESVTPYLINLLSSSNEHSRWEAAKAFADIKDTNAALALVKTLMDNNIGVRWLAAEALIALGRQAIVPLLQGLLVNFGDIWFRQGALHILRSLQRLHLLDPQAEAVLEALRSSEPEVAAPWAAERALEKYLDLPEFHGRTN